jgi:hypothetical protein
LKQRAVPLQDCASVCSQFLLPLFHLPFSAVPSCHCCYSDARYIIASLFLHKPSPSPRNSTENTSDLKRKHTKQMQWRMSASKNNDKPNNGLTVGNSFFNL